MEHPNTLHKLSKTIGHTEKNFQVSCAGKNSDSLLYSETKKDDKFLDQKKWKNIQMVACL